MNSIRIPHLVALALLSAVAACGGGGGGGSDGGGTPPPAPALTLVSLDPGGGSTGVPRDAIVHLKFSMRLEPASVTSTTLSLRRGSTDVPATLQVNDTDVDLVPAERLVPGAGYSVVAGTGLRGPGGERLAAALTSTFTVAPRGWDAAATSVSPATSPLWLDAAMDPRGNLLAIWLDDDGSRIDLRGAYRDVTGAWSTATLIDDLPGDAGALSNWPAVAMRDDGKAMVVWSQSVGATWNVYAREFDPASGWGAVVLIRAGGTTSHGAKMPEVAIDPGGFAHFVWVRGEGASSVVETANIRRAAPGLSAVVRVDSASGASYGPKLGFDAAGNLIFAWTQLAATGRRDIWAAEYRVDGTSTAAHTIGTDVGNNSGALQPQLSVAPDGNAAVAWVDVSGEYNARHALFVNGQWSGGLLEQRPDFVSGVAIAMDRDGSALAAWDQLSSAGVYPLWAARVRTGEVGTPFTFGAGGRAASHGSLVLAADGSATLAWASTLISPDGNSTDWQVLAARSTARRPFDAPVRLDSLTDPARVDLVHVAGNADGDAAVLWLQRQGNDSSVYARVLE